MTNEELINVCQAVSHGSIRKVKKLANDTEGTVIAYEGQNLTVQVEDRIENWGYNECKEV